MFYEGSALPKSKCNLSATGERSWQLANLTSVLADIPAVTGISLLIFDADGVLLDTPHKVAWMRAVNEYLGLAVSGIVDVPHDIPSEFYTRFIAGRTRSQGAESLLTFLNIFATAEEIGRLSQIKQRIFQQELERGNSRLFDDGIFLLNSLAANGVRIAVATASSNAKDILFRHLQEYPNLAGCVEVVVSPEFGSNLTNVSKKDLVGMVLELLEVDSRKAIFIDDSLDAVKSVAELGIFCVNLDRYPDDNRDYATAEDLVSINSLLQIEIVDGVLSIFHSNAIDVGWKRESSAI